MTRQQYELNCEILQSLDKIDNCVMGSETLVMDSIMGAYSKAVTVLEHCSDTADISSFNIIQESFILEDGEGEPTDGKGNNKEKLIMKILLFIPRMIRKFIDFLMGKLSSLNTTKKLLQRIDELERMSTADKKDILQRFERMDEDKDRTDKILLNGMENLHTVIKKKDSEHKKDIAEIKDNSSRHAQYARSNIVLINDVINVMNGNISVTVNFDKMKNVYGGILKMFKVLEKYDVHKPSSLPKDIRQQISSDEMKDKYILGDGGFDIFNKLEVMKIPVFRKNMQDIMDIKIEITQIGQRVCDKLNKQAKVFEDTELNKKQQVKLDDVTMVSKYITQYMNFVQNMEKTLDSLLRSKLRDFDEIKRMYKLSSK